MELMIALAAWTAWGFGTNYLWRHPIRSSPDCFESAQYCELKAEGTEAA